ncbi:hypothetical protein [Algoriphagus namhaensis]
MRKRLIGLLFPFLSIAVQAQEIKKLELSPDLHVRTFWMNTSYREDFKSDFALGASVNLGAKLTYTKNWTFQAGYRVFANIWSTDIWEEDLLSGQGNRYETGLFDLLNPGDDFFGKLELFNLSYSSEKWGAQIGRFGVNTPWINPQNGRLSPTGMEGLRLWWKPGERWKFETRYVHRISVRGTSRWLGVGESLGVFPIARDITGRPSRYAGNTKSDFVGILEVSHQTASGDQFLFSQTLAQNLFNTFDLSWNKTWKQSEAKGAWISGLQLGFQHGIGEGGNALDSLRYKNPEDKNWYLSARFGYKKSKWLGHINFTSVQGNGRWLSPREWGKDPWFTFIPRERNEGYESVTALVGFLGYSLDKVPMEFYTHYGYHFLPDLSDAAANKYNFPSYRQINLGVKYKPKKLSGADIHLLVMNKEAIGNEVLSPNQRYNKVEMWHLNLIVDFRFQ